MKYLPLLLPLLIILAGSPSQAQQTRTDGWTIFAPSPDTRILYVSDLDGDDASARPYSAAEVGADPFDPQGSIQAFKTLQGAAAVLRPGYPDWILFRKGETWLDQYFGSRHLSGRSASEPLLIGAYGSGAERPRISTGRQGFVNFTGAPASHIAITGLEIQPHTRSGTDEPVGIRSIDAPFHGLLIEDCHISGYFQHMAVHHPVSPDVPYCSRLTVRRSVLADAYVTSQSHANAFFIANVDTILFEENLLDHNGWSSTIPGSQPTGFRHNSYFQVSCRALTFTGNIVSRAAATGGGHRCGGQIIDNLYLANPQNLQFGTHEETIAWPGEAVTGEIAYNVILDSRPESFEPGKGIRIQRARDLSVHHNIIAHFTAEGDYNAGILINETEGISIRHNIVYKWGNNRLQGPARSSGITIGASLRGTQVIDSNDIQMLNPGGFCVSTYSGPDRISFSANRYYSLNSPGDWFEPAGSFAQWVSQSGETDALAEEAGYADPERSITSYMTSVGETGGLDAFISARRSLSRSQWDERFTAGAVNNYIREGFDALPPSGAVDPGITGHSALLLYPNPVSGQLLVHCAWQPGRYRLYTAAGLLLRSGTPDTTGIFSLDCSGLPAGVYFLQVDGREPGQIAMKRFLRL